LTVTGHGQATVVPDRAVVRVSVEHRSDSVEGACAGAASGVEAVSTVARRFTEGAQVASADFGLWPAHDPDGRPRGFEARHALTVAVPDLDAAGALVTALAAEVGDRLRIDSFSLEVADPGEAQARAREEAYADARARAEQLATLAGAALGQVRAVVEGGTAGAPRAGLAMAKVAMETSFEPGERAVGSSVTVTWALLEG
jgi:uncharacterized protein YggE